MFKWNLNYNLNIISVYGGGVAIRKESAIDLKRLLELQYYFSGCGKQITFN